MIEAARRDGIRRRLIGVTIAGADAGQLPGVGSEIQHQGESIGVLANMGYSYTLGQAIGVGFIDTPYAYVGLDYRALRKELKFSASSPAPTKNDRITRGFCLKRPTAR